MIRAEAVLEQPQRRQEDQYQFPYHYLPKYQDGRYKQVASLPWGYEYLSYIDYVKSRVDELQFESLTDFGCGDGRVLHDLQQRDPSKRYLGVDYSERAIALARALTPDIRFACCDIYSETDTVEPADLGIAIETLEHVPIQQVPLFLAGIHRRLKPGARLVLTVPTKNTPLNHKHYQHFDVQTLAKSLGDLFKIDETQYLNRKSVTVERIIEPLLHNRLWILNQGRLLGAIYRLYCRRFLSAEDDTAKRLFVVASRIGS